MDTSNPAVLVNAELLDRYVGRKVRAVIQVIRKDGMAVIGKSTDDRQLAVKGSPLSLLSTYVEVIGIADSQSSIAADTWTNFGDSFGTDLMLCAVEAEIASSTCSQCHVIAL